MRCDHYIFIFGLAVRDKHSQVGQGKPGFPHFADATQLCTSHIDSLNLLTSAGFNAKLQATALTTIREAVNLPSDVAFRCSMDHSFAQLEDLDAPSERVLLVTNCQQVDLGKGKGKLEKSGRCSR